MADNPDSAPRFLRGLDVETLCGHEVRRVADDGGGGIVLDWKLVLRPINRVDARRFIKSHHAHCATPVTWRFQTSISNGSTLMGVVVVGNPVAPGLNGRGIVEVNRLCVRRNTAAALRWNATSMLHGWRGRQAARQGWRKIITWTRLDEPGTSLRASGWSPEARVPGRGWHINRRARSNTNAWIDKTRWATTLTPENGSIAARDRHAGRFQRDARLVNARATIRQLDRRLAARVVCRSLTATT
jgi:hypothetical protein